MLGLMRCLGTKCSSSPMRMVAPVFSGLISLMTPVVLASVAEFGSVFGIPTMCFRRSNMSIDFEPAPEATPPVWKTRIES